MYKSLYQLKKELTDYQLLLLVYLSKGYHIVTNEGANFRAWMQYKDVVCKEIKVSKDTGDKLFALGLIKDFVPQRRGIFKYTLSEKGQKLLNMIDDRKLKYLQSKVLERK